MILFDTETTGLPKPATTPLAQQPFITEFAALKVDLLTLFETERITFLVKPPIPIPPEITKMTGITDEMLKDEKPFSAYYTTLCSFFLGESQLCAHNAPFDVALLGFELARLGKITKFPWPPFHFCTVERSQGIKNKYLKLTDLYKHYYGVDPEQKHRAIGDCEILLAVVRKMREEGLI